MNLTTSLILSWMHYQLHQKVLLQLGFPAISFITFKSYLERDYLLKIYNLCEHDWEAVV